MNEAKKKYQKKIKKREVTFYKKDTQLYEFSKQINFQQFVKEALKVYERKCLEKVLKIFRDGDENGNRNI